MSGNFVRLGQIAFLQTSRRRFLLGIGACALAAGNCLAADAAPRLSAFTRHAKALGTEVSITVLHTDKDVAANALDAAFKDLTLVESLMSIYRPDSQISILNRTGSLNDPHPYLLEVLRKSREISEKSGGAFDITVQPLWELFAAAKKNKKLPNDAEIEAARKKVDWRKIEITEHLVTLRGEGMAVTLNAIAQGYAADRVLTALRKCGIEHALANTGEIGAIGRRADGRPWLVGIQHPRKPDAYIALAQLDNRCMATSGDYATTFSDDFVYNHIFDPSTGRSPRTFSSVSVVADHGMDADALATAVFVMGYERGMKLVKSIGRTEAMFVFKDGRVIATRDFPTAEGQ